MVSFDGIEARMPLRPHFGEFVPASAPSADLASEQMVELERAVTAAETLVERLKIVEPAMQAAFAALGDEACTYRERVSRATSILSRAMLKVSR
jgi:hypothetical protein